MQATRPTFWKQRQKSSGGIVSNGPRLLHGSACPRVTIITAAPAAPPLAPASVPARSPPKRAATCLGVPPPPLPYPIALPHRALLYSDHVVSWTPSVAAFTILLPASLIG
ncbi:hypothetical protein ACP70R_036973 [Stipagrostis hirtigluma subsp. patula]